ncbi:allantoicase [Chromatocurvus halotolerans]|uniref:Probable allantoicase n=1 Tax=Chromatocurvus halotolerans TaxID=1132028 RepID=A0A4R2KYM2_9GAMM|nr:allantoicase [Chromatocurvus halotolerans]TCO78242.1 allantoicase [Chromatocurvus halotolerans]
MTTSAPDNTDAAYAGDPRARAIAESHLNLLDERLGARALACSDEWFAEAGNLVKPGRGIFREGHFVATGQWMDGWESRRSFGRRPPGAANYDWCILRLGAPGSLNAVDIDTHHFRGNAPEAAALDALFTEDEPDNDADWLELLPKSQLQAHSRNLFAIETATDRPQPFTHVRLRIFPDGGVARLRAWGRPLLRRDHFIDGELIDLSAAQHGGRGVAVSNRFYSSPDNLLMPGRGVNMGDGWETRRRRDDGHDWAIVQLGVAGTIHKVVVDTAHFKGNFPHHMTLEAINTDRKDIEAANLEWQTLLPARRLFADREHLFLRELVHDRSERFTHVRLNIFPDGGVSRLRILGFPDWISLA